jgi:hypothetical protein
MKPLSEREKVVRDAAERLCEMSNDHDWESLRRYVHALCYEPDSIIITWPLRAPGPWIDSRNLLKAAIINGCTDIIKNLFNCPNFLTVFGTTHRPLAVELWEISIELIASFGRTDMLEMVLKERQFSRRVMRGFALGPAIRSGHLEMARLLCEPLWGPIDFILSTKCIYGNLTNGMLHSTSSDVSSQLFVLLRSCATAQYPVDVEEPGRTKLLLEVASNALQRVDVATWLLDNDASAEYGNADGGATPEARAFVLDSS